MVGVSRHVFRPPPSSLPLLTASQQPLRLTCASSGGDSAAAAAAAVAVSSASFVASTSLSATRAAASTSSWPHPLLPAAPSDDRASAPAVPLSSRAVPGPSFWDDILAAPVQHHDVRVDESILEKNIYYNCPNSMIAGLYVGHVRGRWTRQKARGNQRDIAIGLMMMPFFVLASGRDNSSVFIPNP
jgi:hypothetical protein